MIATNIYTVNNLGHIETDMVLNVLDIDDQYYIELFNHETTNSVILDRLTTGYNELKEGHSIIITNKKLKDLSFDLSDDGRLIVRAVDANNYSIGTGSDGSDGHLLYNYEETGIPEMIIETTFIVK